METLIEYYGNSLITAPLSNPCSKLSWHPIDIDNVLALFEGYYSKDRFGTKVPFSGTFEHPRPEIFTTIGNAFRNAFVKAFAGELEPGKKLPKVEPEKKQ